MCITIKPNIYNVNDDFVSNVFLDLQIEFTVWTNAKLNLNTFQDSNRNIKLICVSMDNLDLHRLGYIFCEDTK